MNLISLCTGYGGLDAATTAVLQALGRPVTLTAYAEFDDRAAAVFARHHPTVPNLGDITTIDWSHHDADILTAGYPCQPFSAAGRRLGVDDPRHLWPHVGRAIDELRPDLVVLENVRGHLRRGFGVVLADLAGLGYDARWNVVRASDVGAPHRRERLFIVARPADADSGQRDRRQPHEVGSA
ncbi:DNA methylase [Gordonia phage Upyo]|nr:DNA methylase [Gordonia phage Upyo]